jgi:secreted trypsin-like serine protease
MFSVSRSLFLALISVLSVSSVHASEEIVGTGAILSKPANYPSTCFLTITESSMAEDTVSGCSGTLIAPTKIATAGHCFSKDFSLYRSSLNIRCGDVYVGRVSEVKLPDSSAYVYDRNTGREIPRTTVDVAVVTLSKPVNLPTVAVAKTYDEIFGGEFTDHGYDLKPGTTCYLAGYGINPRGGTGKLYTANLDKMSIVFKDGAIQLTEVGGGKMKTSADHGDSGGSLICEGQNHIKTLIGVTVSIATDRTYNYFAPTWSNHL